MNFFKFFIFLSTILIFNFGLINSYQLTFNDCENLGLRSELCNTFGDTTYLIEREVLLRAMGSGPIDTVHVRNFNFNKNINFNSNGPPAGVVPLNTRYLSPNLGSTSYYPIYNSWFQILPPSPSIKINGKTYINSLSNVELAYDVNTRPGVSAGFGRTRRSCPATNPNAPNNFASYGNTNYCGFKIDLVRTDLVPEISLGGQFLKLSNLDQKLNSKDFSFKLNSNKLSGRLIVNQVFNEKGYDWELLNTNNPGCCKWSSGTVDSPPSCLSRYETYKCSNHVSDNVINSQEIINSNDVNFKKYSPQKTDYSLKIIRGGDNILGVFTSSHKNFKVFFSSASFERKKNLLQIETSFSPYDVLFLNEVNKKDYVYADNLVITNFNDSKIEFELSNFDFGDTCHIEFREPFSEYYSKVNCNYDISYISNLNYLMPKKIYDSGELINITLMANSDFGIITGMVEIIYDDKTVVKFLKDGELDFSLKAVSNKNQIVVNYLGDSNNEPSTLIIDNFLVSNYSFSYLLNLITSLFIFFIFIYFVIAFFKKVVR